MSAADATETYRRPESWSEAQVVLRSRMPGYEERPEQNVLASAIEDVLTDGGVLVGQAGCGCLAADTEIGFSRAGLGGRIKLVNLVRRHNGEDQRYSWDPSIPTYVQREAEDGTIRLALLANAWCSGVKTTYSVTTDSGRTVRATNEHPFLTDGGWKRLDELVAGDRVHVRGSQSAGAPRKPKVSYRRICALPHPYRNGKTVPEHRLVAEATINGMDYPSYLDRVRSGDTASLSFLDPTEFAVHHLDGDPYNNTPDNLKVLTHREHHQQHAREGSSRHFLYKATTEAVVSVEQYGEEMTYDIEVSDAPHNFVANGFVVHNTGKSVAALVPAIASGHRVLYSTATKSLQGQVFDKDLPFLRDSLFPGLSFAMLKGKSNYVCHSRLEEMDPSSGMKNRVLAAVSQDEPISGERESLPFAVTDSEWRDMTISSDDCPGCKECPFGIECLHGVAAEAAAASQIVVVNHALVMQDASINLGVVLGEYHHLIVDECHELEEYATSAFTGRFTAGSLKALSNNCHGRLRDLGIDYEKYADDANAAAALILQRVDGFFNSLPKDGRRILQKWWVDVAEGIGLIDIINAVSIIRKPFLAAAYAMRDDNFGSIDRQRKSVILAYLSRLSKTWSHLTNLIMKKDIESVRFVEDGEFPRLVIAPVSVAGELAARLWSNLESVTLMSATVLVDGKADFIKGRLGLADFSPNVIDAGTPFDYRSQSLLYIPRGIADPSQANRARWENDIVGQISNLVAASRGRALVLFTSTSQMNKAFDALQDKIEYPMRKQGQAPLSQLVAWFRDTNEAVLFGVRSLFTGMDVQGDSLSLVIIDKLPFPVPTDPIFEARSEFVDRNGGSSFMDLSVPMMALPLQQAFGRLIRTKTDRGVVAILDNRLVSKGYGKVITNSLPPARDIESLGDVFDFFNPEG